MEKTEGTELNERYRRLVEPEILALFAQLGYHKPAPARLVTRAIVENGHLAKLREIFKVLGVDVNGL